MLMTRPNNQICQTKQSTATQMLESLTDWAIKLNHPEAYKPIRLGNILVWDQTQLCGWGCQAG